MYECIEQRRHLNRRNPIELLKSSLLAHYLDLEYREIRLQLGLEPVVWDEMKQARLDP